MKRVLKRKTATAKAKAKAAETILDSAIGWQRVKGKARGVFARRSIHKGEVIERAPVVPMGKKHLADGYPPDGYVLEWREDKKGEEYALVLGYVMLYNHSDTPNMKLETDFRSQTINVIAARPVKAGEELTWNYNCELWFDQV